MNTYAIPALKDKRAAIAGRVISHNKEIARHQKDLANLDATITLFDPSHKIGSINLSAPRSGQSCLGWAERGMLIIDA